MPIFHRLMILRWTKWTVEEQSIGSCADDEAMFPLFKRRSINIMFTGAPTHINYVPIMLSVFFDGTDRSTLLFI